MKQHKRFFLGCALFLVTMALYWPATEYKFVVVDDNLYVTENPWVSKGLSVEGIKWALGSTWAANWHPLTWISHMLDCSLYGQFAGGHHLTNIIIHALNTVLLFLLLNRLTKRLWPSVLVAALFGWHPLHVESVAWVSERKDVLSGLFFLLTLWAYGRFAEYGARTPKAFASRAAECGMEQAAPNAQHVSTLQRFNVLTLHPFNPSTLYYLLALALFALGLMSKSMLVTLPCVLLLLDFWPLNRAPLGHESIEGVQRLRAWSRLVAEKVPFFLLSLGACILALATQKSGGAIKSLEEVPQSLRALNAMAAYGAYLWKALWPTDLCVFYPLPSTVPWMSGVLSGLSIAGLGWLFFRARGRAPWLLVGFLWLLGTLVPVIGIVQVGQQAMADRYTYIPFIGLFVAVVWGADYWLGRRSAARGLGFGVAIAALVACAVVSRHQLAYWRDSVVLCTRAVSATKDNAFAENDLGAALYELGHTDEAMGHYREALRLRPNSPKVHYNIGVGLGAAGQFEQAGFHFREALKACPRSEVLHNNLGVILAQQGKLEPAIEQFERAIQLNPEYPKPFLNYAFALQRFGRTGPAITNYTKALQLDPAWPDALDKLAFLLATCPEDEWRNPAAAIGLSRRANELTAGQSPAYLGTLARTFAAAGQYSNAVSTAELARQKAMIGKDQEAVGRLGDEIRCYQAGRVPERLPSSQVQANRNPY